MKASSSMSARLLIAIVGGVVALTPIIWAYSSGPPNGRTGAPGETDCSFCHNSFLVDSGPGSTVIDGPGSYTPGDTVELRINVYSQGQQRWGFELTALDSAFGGVGVFVLTEPSRTQLSQSGSRSYVKHTLIGTDSGMADSSLGWTLRWVAPSSDRGPVTFYAAANAADGDNATDNDYIYRTTYT